MTPNLLLHDACSGSPSEDSLDLISGITLLNGSSATISRDRL